MFRPSNKIRMIAILLPMFTRVNRAAERMAQRLRCGHAALDNVLARASNKFTQKNCSITRTVGCRRDVSTWRAVWMRILL
jgi:hypothetical protein